MSDIKYAAFLREFDRRAEELTKAQVDFARLSSSVPSQVSPVDAAQQVQAFWHAHPFESHDFKKLCDLRKQSVALVQSKSEKLRASAISKAQNARKTSIEKVRKAVGDVCVTVTNAMSAQTKAVSEAKSRWLTEARKLNIDLEKGGA